MTILSLVTAAACSGGLEGAHATLPAIGSTLPAFSYAGLDSGAVVTSTSLQGAPTVIALWSSTCPASRDALSAIVALHAQLASDGIRVVILANDTTVSALTAMRADFGAVPVAFAAGALQEVFSLTRLGPWRRALGMPAFLVLDRGSIVRYRQVGIEQAAVDRLVELRRQVARVQRT
jgi:thiol-disulfide isomerase/thioredoxin